MNYKSFLATKAISVRTLLLVIALVFIVYLQTHAVDIQIRPLGVSSIIDQLGDKESITLIILAIALLVQAFQFFAGIRQMKITKNFAIRDYDSQVLGIIEKFNSEAFLKDRKNCWVLISNLKKKEVLRDMYGMFVAESINYYGDDDKTFMGSQEYQWYASFIRVIRTFELISSYKLHKIPAKTLQFYYMYYRKLFSVMIEIYERVFGRNDLEKHMQLKHGWISIVGDLNAKMEKYKLSIEADDITEYKRTIDEIESEFDKDQFFTEFIERTRKLNAQKAEETKA